MITSTQTDNSNLHAEYRLGYIWLISIVTAMSGLLFGLDWVMVLAVFQEWCGINTIFKYTEESFQVASYDISSVLQNMAWTGLVNMVFTFVALGTVDRVGRRPLMLFGAAGLAAIYSVMSFCHGNPTQ